ncbi:DTW domain-containing protein, partial [Salmonella enterica]
MSHAVSRLRTQRLARAIRPFVNRGSRAERCPGCRVIPAYCLCAWRPKVQARSAMCLLMHDVEPMKPSNTGWLIADVIDDTSAFAWSRTEVDPGLLT